MLFRTFLPSSTISSFPAIKHVNMAVDCSTCSTDHYAAAFRARSKWLLRDARRSLRLSYGLGHDCGPAACSSVGCGASAEGLSAVSTDSRLEGISDDPFSLSGWISRRGLTFLSARGATLDLRLSRLELAASINSSVPFTSSDMSSPSMVISGTFTPALFNSSSSGIGGKSPLLSP